MTKDKKNNSFEESMEDLEKIVKKLEDGNLNLDEALSEFQKGVASYRHCNEILNQVEGEVKLIIEKENGKVEITDFKDIE